MSTTIEPGKRILRTIISSAVGFAVAAGAVVPVITGVLDKALPANYVPVVTTAGTAVVAFSAGVDALLNTPAIVKWLPSWLTPTAVQKLAAADTVTVGQLAKVASDATTAVQALAPDVAPIVTEVSKGDLSAAVGTTLEEATKAAPEVVASLQQIASDVGSITIANPSNAAIVAPPSA